MKKYASAIIWICSLVMAMSIAMGCDNKGPAEKAGEKIDKTVESVKDAVEDAGDKISGKGPAEKMGEKIDQTIDDVKKSMETKN